MSNRAKRRAQEAREARARGLTLRQLRDRRMYLINISNMKPHEAARYKHLCNTLDKRAGRAYLARIGVKR